MGAYGDVWGPMGTFGDPWGSSGTYRGLWGPMGTYLHANFLGGLDPPMNWRVPCVSIILGV